MLCFTKITAYMFKVWHVPERRSPLKAICLQAWYLYGWFASGNLREDSKGLRQPRGRSWIECTNLASPLSLYMHSKEVEMLEHVKKPETRGFGITNRKVMMPSFHEETIEEQGASLHQLRTQSIEQYLDDRHELQSRAQTRNPLSSLRVNLWLVAWWQRAYRLSISLCKLLHTLLLLSNFLHKKKVWINVRQPQRQYGNIKPMNWNLLTATEVIGRFPKLR